MNKMKQIANKKAQTALEYLLTYGWSILIIIIVGAALYALGVFSPGTFTGKRSTGYSQFQIVDFKLDTDANLTIVLGNRLGKTIVLNEINAVFKQDECSQTINENIGPNVQKTYTLECLTEWNGPLDQRSSYTVITDLNFTDPDSGLDHIDTGTFFGIIE
jgi:hypothetical protein